MKRTTIFLDEGIERDLKSLAYRKREPVSHLVREAIARYVESEVEAAPRLPSFVGIAESGFTDTSDRVDEILFDTLEKEMGLAPVPALAPKPRKTAARKR